MNTATTTGCEMCEAEAFDLALDSFAQSNGGRWPNPGEETHAIKADPTYGYLHYLEDGYTDHSQH